jgi:membrane-bound ClpP family serine protease
VTPQAKDTATFLALGCTEIVMEKNATLGGFEDLLRAKPKYADAIAPSLEKLAEKQGYPPIIARGMLDLNLTIRRVERRTGKLIEHKMIDEKEWQADQKGERLWQEVDVLKRPGQLLNLDSALAKKLDIAKFVSQGGPSDRVSWLKEHYGLKQIREAKTDWLDALAAFLCRPMVSWFLVMVGIIGLVLELKIPGVGFPGVIAALCFVLYFWAQQEQMRGDLTMLAILLFVLGLILIAVEVFVFPGFGVTGVSGVLLMLVGLALVTVVKMPETTQEWVDFGSTLTLLGVGLVAAVGSAFVIGWYLPHIPYANRLVLPPPSDALDPFDEDLTAAESAASLLGAIGEAATTLRPAGKARFGEEFVDVVAEGSYVQPGARVQVIEIEGNRIVVKEV